MSMRYDTERIVELAEQNPHNVLDINLAGDNSIGSMGRTHIEVIDSGEEFIEAKLLNFAQVDNREDEKLFTDAKYIDENEYGPGATLWLEGRTYHLKSTEIATATPSNMLSNAEKKEDGGGKNA